MTIRNLDVVFSPRSVALVGASGHPNSVVPVVARNLLSAAFPGRIMPVKPKHAFVAVTPTGSQGTVRATLAL